MARKKSGRNSNGLGSITQRRDGLFQGSLQYQGKRKTVYGKTREIVRSKLDAIDFGTEESGTFFGYAREHAETLAPASRASYLSNARLYLEPFLSRNADSITPRELSAHLRLIATTYSTSVVRQTSSILKTALDGAVEDGAIEVNPARLLRRKLPKSKAAKIVLPWTPEQTEQFEAFLKSIPDSELVEYKSGETFERYVKRWTEAAYLIRVRSGLRPSELLGLRLSDLFLDEENPYLFVRGQYQRVTLPIRYRPVAYVDGKRVVLPMLDVADEKLPKIGHVRVEQTKTEESKRKVYIDQEIVAALRSWLSVRDVEHSQVKITFAQAERSENHRRRIDAAIKDRLLPEDASYFEREDAVFTMLPEDAALPVTFEVDTRQHTKVVKAAGLPHTSRYQGRHTSVTRALDDGVALQVISRQVGHRSTTTTWTIYGGKDANSLEAAAAAQRFNRTP